MAKAQEMDSLRLSVNDSFIGIDPDEIYAIQTNHQGIPGSSLDTEESMVEKGITIRDHPWQ